MSKAFTKDDAADEPLAVRPRVPLAPDQPNYVTPRGLRALHDELDALHATRGAGDARAQQAVAQRLLELEARIGSASLVEAGAHPRHEVRFGATVTIRQLDEERKLQIVGVDEADAAHGRVAFNSPIARALLGKRVGETATMRTPRGEEDLEVVAIGYDDAGCTSGASGS